MRHHAVAVRVSGVRCARQVCSCGSQAMPEAQLLGHVVQDHPSCRESGTHVDAAGRKLQTSNVGYIHVAPEQLPYEPASSQMLSGMRLHSKQHNVARGDTPPDCTSKAYTQQVRAGSKAGITQAEAGMKGLPQTSAMHVKPALQPVGQPKQLSPTFRVRGRH
jgi:hypothetical protein